MVESPDLMFFCPHAGATDRTLPAPAGSIDPQR
jgi:hypothetical protein